LDEITVTYEGNLKTHLPFLGTTDPQDFSPIDLFVSSLGSCVLTLMGMAAKRLGVNIAGSRVVLTKAMGRRLPRKVGEIKIAFFCQESFSSAVQEELERAGRECPIHHSLHSDIKQEFFFTWGD
jgi:putative redox protein